MPLFQNEFSYENEFDLHENEPGGGTHFHIASYEWFRTRTGFDTGARWIVLDRSLVYLRQLLDHLFN